MPSFAVQRDQATAGFFDGTARGEFLLVKDTQAGEVLGPRFDPALDPERYVRVPAAGTGTVVSWVVAYEWAADEVGDGETIPYFTVTEETNR